MIWDDLERIRPLGPWFMKIFMLILVVKGEA